MPKTTSAAANIVKEHFDKARSAGITKPEPTVLRILVGTEFGFMGRGEDGKIVFDGIQQIDPEIYTAATLEAQQQMREMPPGMLYVSPTAMIDTGQTIDGKPVIENRGFVVSSGPDGDIVEHTKRHTDPLDNVRQGLIVQGHGPILVAIKDVLGTGLTRYVAIAVCKDYQSDLVSGKVTFPIAPDLIISPSAGWPKGMSPGNVDVLVNDSLHNPFFSGENRLQTGVWEPTEEKPELAGCIEALIRPDSPALCIISAMGLTSFTEALYERYTTPEPTMKLLPYTHLPELRAILTVDRLLPRPTVPDSMMVQIVDASDSSDASIVTNGLTSKDYEQLASQVANVSADIPHELITKPLDRLIDERVAQILEDDQAPASGSIDEVIAKVDTDELHAAVSQRLSDVLWETIGADETLTQIADVHGETMLRFLVDAAVAQPLKDQLTETNRNTNWVESAVRRSASSRLAHAVAEEARQAQAAALAIATQADDLRGELAAQEKAVKEARADAARQPNDSGLKATVARLEQEIQDLVEREQASSEQEQVAKREKEAAEKSLKESEEDAARAKSAEERETATVFHGE
ncbi:MAG: hypothetical protein ABL894_04795 [Hyphomicrobium sp.]